MNTKCLGFFICTLTVIFLGLLTFNAHSQTPGAAYSWAKSIGNSSDQKSYSIAVDSSGNVYVTGYTFTGADFDPGPDTAFIDNGFNGNDVFFAKYSSNGDYLWAKMIGADLTDEGYDIAVDGSGNVYITGVFRTITTCDFDPGPGTANLTAVGNADIFFAKYDSNGNYLWAKGIGSVNDDYGRAIAVDASGNVYISGYFLGAADFDPDAGTATLTPVSGSDVFFAKYNSSGNYLWANSISAEVSYSMTMDLSGNLYLTGYFAFTADFDPGVGIANLTSAGDLDVFFAKYNNSGAFVWAKNVGGTNSDVANCINLDPSGNIYLTGSFALTADFDPGAGTANLISSNGDIFFAKYNNSGNYLWAKNIGGTSTNVGNGIVVDASSNVFVTGYFQGTADFDPDGGTVNMMADDLDVFFAKYNSNGNYLWAKRIGGTWWDEGSGIALGPSGNVHITGFYQGTADFDPDPTLTDDHTFEGGYDFFFAKYCSNAGFSESHTNVSCYGLADGNIDISVTGLSSPVTYLWSNGSTLEDLDSLASGTDSVLVMDSIGCRFNSREISITQPTLLVVTGTTLTNVSCNGGSDGSAGVGVVGGVSPYSLQWSSSPADTNFSVSGLSAGTYTVTVTDFNGCTKVDSILITEPPLLAVSFSSTGATCSGGSNGTATANVSGGTSPYSYTWSTSPTQTTQTAINLLATTYTVTVKDNNNCTVSNSVTITQPFAITINITQTNISCYGGSNGSITINAGGGTPPYQYSNNGGVSYQSPNIFSNLSAVTFTLVVKDSNNCTFSSSATLTEPTQLTFTTSKTNVACNGGNNGSITVNATGGVTTYLYSNDNGFSYQPSNVFNNLVADTYSVVVKDANNCTSAANVILTEPGSISASTLQTDITCYGGNDGSIVVLASGGANPLQYSKNGGSTYQFSNSFNSLLADTYSVVVKDANNCTTSPLSVIITSPPVINIGIASGNVSCYGGNDGSASATVSGGSGNYTYQWSNSASTSSINLLPSSPYTITITDSLGCTKTSSVTITEPPILTATASPTNILCNGDGNGSITVNASGGTGTIEYSADSGSTWQAQNTFSNFSAGTYFVVAKDFNNCSTLPQSVIISEPSLLTFTVTQTDINCNGGGDGSIDVTATGGITPYQYSNDSGNTFQSSNVFDSLTAANYYIFARDNNGCDTAAAVAITEPAAISFTTIQSDVSCYGAGDGSITVSASGGFGTLEYSNDGGNTYQFSNTFTNLSDGNYDMGVKDGNNCLTAPATVTITQPADLTLSLASVDPTCTLSDASATAIAGGGVPTYTYQWSNGSMDSAATALGNGIYWITITDGNNCTISDSITVTEFIYEQDICIVTVDTAVKKNLVAWEKTPGMGTQGFVIYQEIFTNVYDSIGYVPFDSLSEYVDFASDPKTKAERYKIATMDSCGNISLLSDSHRTILLTASVGVNNERNLAWNDYEGIWPISQYRIWRGTALNNITLIDSVVYGTNLYADWDTLTGVDSLYYFVELVHLTGCTSTIKLKTYNSSKSNTASMEAPASTMATTVTTTGLTCNGGGDGTATVNASGGDPSYTYIWSDPQSQSSSTATGLAAGTYYVTVTDSKGVSVSDTAVISEPPAILVTTSVVDETCTGADGSATAIATGGTGGFNYVWSNGQSNANTTSLTAGSYTVTATDGFGCTGTTTATVSSNNITLTLSTSATDATCNNIDGTATASTSGGSGVYNYLWSNGQSAATATGLAQGTYSVTATDSKGCSGNTSVAVNSVNISLTLVSSANPVTCYGFSNGSATVLAASGTAPYTYQWNSASNNQSNTTATGLAVGTYDVTVTDSKGCYNSQSVSITQPVQITLAVSSVNSTCGNADGSVTVTASGGTGGLYYAWNNGQTNSSATALSAGNYTVTVTDGNNCTQSTVTSVSDANAPALAISSTAIACNGDGDGTATVTATGGTPPYTYQWDGAAGSQTDSSATGLSGGNYSVSVSDSAGCLATLSTIVTEPAAIAITASVTDATTPANNDGEIDITLTGGTGAYTYMWNTTDVTEDLSGLSAGIYTVTVTDANNCQMVYTDTVKLITGIILNYDPSKVMVFPNPFRDETNILISLVSNSQIVIEVYSVSGEKIAVLANGMFVSGMNNVTFNSKKSGYPAGIYFLKVYVDDRTSYLKLVEME